MMPKRGLSERYDRDAGASAPLWFRVSTPLLVAVAIALLLVVLGERVYIGGLSAVTLVTVIAALVCSLYLPLHAWYRESKEVYEADREFASVFHHALDGILTLDDQAICQEANPAAFALLGAPPAVLIGHSIAQFYEDPDEFERQWRAFLRHRYRCGRATLRRRDGSKVFVHYTAAANYVPGRHVVILCDSTDEVEARASLRQSNWRLQLMADSIAEVFWMLDAATKKVVEVTPAYEAITGCSLESIARDPLSYQDLIHPEDRVHVLTKLEEAVHSGHYDEEFRIVRPDGDVRWVWVRANPIRSEDKVIRQLVGTAQDITARKLADSQVAQHLAEAETARVEADAARLEAETLRKATLALTQNLRMDAVLDTLLRCVRDVVPYDSASVFLVEEDGRLFVARDSSPATANRPVIIFEPKENSHLERVLVMRKNVYVADTREDEDWQETKILSNIRCWIAVPLTVGETVLGLLSLGSSKPGTFTPDHFRRAKSLAIPAAVAIHNARLYEWAQIYAAERETLLKRADNSASVLPEDPNRFLKN
jgi:PAS domain S-box-containing protein